MRLGRVNWWMVRFSWTYIFQGLVSFKYMYISVRCQSMLDRHDIRFTYIYWLTVHHNKIRWTKTKISSRYLNCAVRNGYCWCYDFRRGYRHFVDEMIVQPGKKVYENPRTDVTFEDHVSEPCCTLYYIGLVCQMFSWGWKKYITMKLVSWCSSLKERVVFIIEGETETETEWERDRERETETERATQ